MQLHTSSGVGAPLPAWTLELGLGQALHVREERLTTRTDACRLLYVSDIHLRTDRSDRLSAQVLNAARGAGPDAVLLGGDLADQRSELGKLSGLIRELGDVAPVMAIGGNHDEWLGMDLVRSAVIQGGGEWIHDSVARVMHGHRVIEISGPEAAPHTSAKADVRILCAHSPRIWKTSRHAGYDLVLAGHLHGCQLVGWQYRDRLFPGALLYPYCFLSHRRGPTRLVVSRGVSDLLPIRWNCPREVVLCHV